MDVVWLCSDAWLVGGSPTAGFLTQVDGYFSNFFRLLAGQVWVDWLFMLGLFFVGITLILGVGVKIAAVVGSIMMFLIYLSSWPYLANNPILDYHIIYILVLIVLAVFESGYYLGLGHCWRKIINKRLWLL